MNLYSFKVIATGTKRAVHKTYEALDLNQAFDKARKEFPYGLFKVFATTENKLKSKKNVIIFENVILPAPAFERAFSRSSSTT
jgi:hypothetical protein